MGGAADKHLIRPALPNVVLHPQRLLVLSLPNVLPHLQLVQGRSLSPPQENLLSETSLLRPGTPSTSTNYVVIWKEKLLKRLFLNRLNFLLHTNVRSFVSAAAKRLARY